MHMNRRNVSAGRIESRCIVQFGRPYLPKINAVSSKALNGGARRRILGTSISASNALATQFQAVNDAAGLILFHRQPPSFPSPSQPASLGMDVCSGVVTMIDYFSSFLLLAPVHFSRLIAIGRTPIRV
jgi:hypothetical protein